MVQTIVQSVVGLVDAFVHTSLGQLISGVMIFLMDFMRRLLPI